MRLRPVDPMNRFRAEASQVSGFLDPCVSFCRGVDTQARATGDALLANVPAGLRGAGSQEAGEIRHVAAAQQQAAAIGRVADELREPSNYLDFHFGGHGSQFPGADIRVYGSGQQVGKHTDGSGAGCDVAVETRMAVEKGVLKQQIGGFRNSTPGSLPSSGSARVAAKAARTSSGDSRGRDWMRAHGSQKAGDTINEFVTE